MEFMSAREAADKWGISQRRVAVLCSEQRIAEATMVGNMWFIPTSAEKPIDARITRYNRIEEKAVKPFLKWAGGKGQLIKEIERTGLLRNVDMRWMDHLDAMEELKRGIYLRSYGQQDPVVAFRMESFDMFDEMTALIREGTVTTMLTFRLKSEDDIKREQAAKITATSGADDGSDKKQPVRKGQKVGRNDPCPCGSGKKYKKCCGRNES